MICSRVDSSKSLAAEGVNLAARSLRSDGRSEGIRAPGVVDCEGTSSGNNSIGPSFVALEK